LVELSTDNSGPMTPSCVTCRCIPVHTAVKFKCQYMCRYTR